MSQSQSTQKTNQDTYKDHPNRVTDKKIWALQVMTTCCLQQGAHFSTMKQLSNECKHAPKWYGTQVYMTYKAWQKELCK